MSQRGPSITKLSTTATLVVTLALALGAIGLAVAAPGGGRDRASAELRSAAGSVLIANSHAGTAVLDARGLRPGRSESGTVTIGNQGDVGGRFAVAPIGVHDTAGAHGGLLSDRLQLLLVDETDPQDAVTVYAGTPAGLGEVDLGHFDAREERDYRLTVTLPNGGVPGSDTSGDNRFQGAALSLGLQWRAAPVAAATPPPAPAPTAVPPAPTPMPVPPTPTPIPAPAALADELGLPSASSCVRSRRLTLRLKGPKGTKVLSATVAVNGRVKARVKGANVRRPVSLRGLGNKPVEVKVTIKASNRRTYTATRSYRPCARR
jgi:hypothetical protein